jgi:hypothetical protein
MSVALTLVTRENVEQALLALPDLLRRLARCAPAFASYTIGPRAGLFSCRSTASSPDVAPTFLIE